MKSFSQTITAVMLCTLFCFGATDGDGQTQSDTVNVYDTSGNAEQLIGSALNAAQAERKHVLLQYGGNWCVWCVRLHDLFENNKEIRRLLTNEYELVLVDVKSNPTIATKYGANIKGVPFLTVLDENGIVVTHQETASLESGDGHDPEKVKAFLERWKVEPRDANEAFNEGLAAAQREQKNVFLHFGAPWCPYCRWLKGWLERKEVTDIFSKYWIDLAIDTDRMTDGKAIYEKYSGGGKGIPWFAIVDASGKTLVTGETEKGENIGFPMQDAELDRFIALLRATSEAISDAELQTLRQDMQTFGQEMQAKRKAQQP